LETCSKILSLSLFIKYRTLQHTKEKPVRTLCKENVILNLTHKKVLLAASPLPISREKHRKAPIGPREASESSYWLSQLCVPERMLPQREHWQDSCTRRYCTGLSWPC